MANCETNIVWEENASKHDSNMDDTKQIDNYN